jgi:hypothetical protein
MTCEILGLRCRHLSNAGMISEWGIGKRVEKGSKDPLQTYYPDIFLGGLGKNLGLRVNHE